MKQFILADTRLKRCKRCGSPGIIMGYDDGIGDVQCSNLNCTQKYFHYSGKCGITKLEAIGMWNGYNMRGINYERTRITTADV